jgi:hypothetical protein
VPAVFALPNSWAESLGGAGFGFCGFFFAILGWGSGLKRAQQAIRDAGYVLDGR